VSARHDPASKRRAATVISEGEATLRQSEREISILVARDEVTVT
jgi:hypothetical protein